MSILSKLALKRLAIAAALLAAISIGPALAFGQAVAGSLPAEGKLFDREFLTVRRLMAAQRSTISKISLQYRAQYILPGNGTTDWHIHGWYAADGVMRASFRAEAPASLGPYETDECWRWTSWNGAVSTEATAYEPAEGNRGTPVSDLYVGGSRLSGALSYFLGGPVGLYYWQTDWYTALDPTKVDLRPIGIDGIDGRSSLCLLVDRSLDGDSERDGKYQRPMLVWIDTSGAAVVTRIIELITEKVALGAPAEITSFMKSFQHIDEISDMYVGTEVVLSDFQPVPRSSFVVPMRSTYLRHHQVGRLHPVQTQVQSISFDHTQLDFDPFAPPVRYPLKVGIAGSGSGFVLSGPEGNKHSIDDLSFLLLSRTYGESFHGDSPRAITLLADGPRNNAVDVMVWLGQIYGIDRFSRSSFLARIPEAARDMESLPPGVMKKIAFTEGFSSTYSASMDFDEYIDRGYPSIISVKTVDSGLKYLASFVDSDGTINLLEPPLKASKVTNLDAFRQVWAGHVLELSKPKAAKETSDD